MIKGAGSIYSVDMLDKGMIHFPSGREQDKRFRHTTQDSTAI